MYFVKPNFDRHVACLKWVGGGALIQIVIFYHKYTSEIGTTGEYMILNLS